MMNRDTITFQVGAARIEMPAADAVQQIIANLSASQSSPRHGQLSPPAIGEQWQEQGGIYAGLMRNPDGRDYHLVVAETDLVGLEWGSRGEEEPGASSEWDGQANTHALANSEHEHPVIEPITRMNIGNRMGWYLPARRELALCYANVPESFECELYWSSTQYSSLTAWGQDFYGGYQIYVIKNGELRARAVRRVLDH